MPIDKILSRAYSRAMYAIHKPRYKALPAPALPHLKAPVPVMLVNRYVPVPVVVAPPSALALAHRDASVEVRREQLQERYLLHRKNRVPRLVDAPREIPEFLKRKAIRVVR